MTIYLQIRLRYNRERAFRSVLKIREPGGFLNGSVRGHVYSWLAQLVARIADLGNGKAVSFFDRELCIMGKCSLK